MITSHSKNFFFKNNNFSFLKSFFKRLVKEAKPGKPTIVAFGLHTFIAGTPAKAKHLERAIEEIKKLDKVWFCNCTMIYNYLQSINQ